MTIKNNYIESGSIINFSENTNTPESSSRVRINPAVGSLAISDIINNYAKTASATGKSSVAIGSTSKASGENSVAIGTHAEVSGSGSIGVGNGSYMGSWYYFTSVTGNNSIGVGQGIKASGDNQAVFGKFNQNQAYNLFEVGSGGWDFTGGNYAETRENALAVNDNGYVVSKREIVSPGNIVLADGLSVSYSGDVQQTIGV